MSEQPHDTEPVTIVLATLNQGKVRELAEPLRAFGLRVVGLDAFPDPVSYTHLTLPTIA